MILNLVQTSRMDWNTLTELYLKESKAFSIALEQGAGLKELQERRLHIRSISSEIIQRYEINNGPSIRLRHQPPYGG